MPALMIFLTIYGPLLIALLFLIWLVQSFRRNVETPNAVPINIKIPVPFIDFEIPITKGSLVRTGLVCGLLLSMSSYLLLDYAALFPSQLKMEVFFDEPGLERSLGVFTKDERAAFKIPSDYKKYRKQYFQQFDDVVRNILKIRTFFNVAGGTVHSYGSTTFVVEKTGGFQNYHIAESRGELHNLMEAPNLPRLEFLTLFEKLDSNDDYLTPDFSDMFIHRTYLLRPIFKQLLAQDRSSQEVRFRFSVVGATKIYFVPWPKYSNTVYFADFGTDGMVPIGYAVYH